MSDFSGKVVVVTGGGGVLGGEFARYMGAMGARVAILDIRKEAAEELASEIVSKGGEAIGLEANVLEIESLKRANEVVSKNYGPCDILINGAGGNHPKGTTTKEYFEPGDESNDDVLSFFDLDPEGVSFVFDLNFKGTLLPSMVFAKEMANRDGVIINISSMNAFTPLTKIPAYSAAKSAVSNFTQWLAVHFSRVNIRVNAIAPGFFLTDQNRTLLTREDGGYTDRAKKILAHTPLQRFGKPEDLNSTLHWLCQPESSFVTGVVIPVDGGFSAFSGV